MAVAYPPALLLKGKNILLGVCGGIAAYKTVSLLRLLKAAGAQVQVVITPTAQDFVGISTFAALSGRPVYSTFTATETGTWHNHVELGLWADAFIIAPATAATLAKAARGQSDNLLLACYLSARCPVLWCPAMDVDMYAHPAVQANLAKLRSYGNTVLEAETGPLASGLEGQGRLPEPETLFEAVWGLVHKNPWWQGKKVLITAGPTRERLDPVRYVGNLSSGKMGYALARELTARGAQVVLVSGPTSETMHTASVSLLPIESADEMAQACKTHADADVQIFAAAVADFKPATLSPTKIKKGGSGLNITLTENVDVAATQAGGKKPGQLFIGFALESGDGREAAVSKLERKGLDLICLNSLDGPLGSPLGADANTYHLLSRSGKEFTLPAAHKTTLAGQLADVIETI